MKSKLKLNINLGISNKLLYGIGLFIFIDTLFLLLNIILIKNNAAIERLKKFGYSEKAANLFLIFSSYGSYFIDIMVLFIFMISVILGRKRFEYGVFYSYFWILFFLIISLLPMFSPGNTAFSYIKGAIIFIPAMIIIWFLFSQTNELKWLRRKMQIKRKDQRYV